MKHIVLQIVLLLPFYICASENPEQRLTITNKLPHGINIWYKPKASTEYVIVLNIGPLKSEMLLPLDQNTITITAEQFNARRILITPKDTEIIITDNCI
jgi:hypothetical protein